MSLFGMEQIQKLEKTLESYPSINSALVSLEKKTKIQKLYLIYGNFVYYFCQYFFYIFFAIFRLRPFTGMYLRQQPVIFVCLVVVFQLFNLMSTYDCLSAIFRQFSEIFQAVVQSISCQAVSKCSSFSYLVSLIAYNIAVGFQSFNPMSTFNCLQAIFRQLSESYQAVVQLIICQAVGKYLPLHQLFSESYIHF